MLTGAEHTSEKIGCLLLHGFTGTPWVFNELADSLQTLHIQVRTPLLPGHGTHPMDLAHTSWREWQNKAEDELRVLQEECDRICIVGVSAGGAVALLLASYFRVHGVATLSTPFRLPSAMVLFLPLAKLFCSCWPKKPLPEGKIRDEEAGYDCYPVNGILEVVKLLRRMRSRLDSVECPVRILHARGDRRVSESNTGQLYQRVKSEDKKIIMFEHPCHTILKGQEREKAEEALIRFVVGGE